MGKTIDVNGDGNQVAGRDLYNNNYTTINTVFSGFDESGKSFIFSPTVMAEIIDAIYNEVEDATDLEDFERPDIIEKNAINDISEEFFNAVIKDCYEKFGKIDSFLKDPANKQYQKKYAAIVAELKGSVSAKVLNGVKLQNLLPVLLNYAKEKNAFFDSEKGYWLQVFSYYMYVNCDIGKKNAETK